MTEMTSEITELLAQAMRAIQYGHKQAAAAYLNRILELDPDNMDAWRWLAECMPNQSKRDYCLERAGLSSSAYQSNHAAPVRNSAVVSQYSLTDLSGETVEPSLAEKHARKAALRGQKRAELPPHFHTALPINIEYPKAATNTRRVQKPTSKPQNPVVPTFRRTPRKPRKTFNLKGLGISALVITAFTFLGYGLFSTGLTTGEKAWNWIMLQIENNTADLPLPGNKPTQQSLYDQPAESVSVLATFFPTPVSTPEPSGITEDSSATSGESNARISAEVPEIQADTTETELSAPETVDTSNEAASNEPLQPVSTPESGVEEISVETAPVQTPVSAEPNGFVAGPKVIGHSIKGNNLEIMQFGNGPVERMMVAGVHGGNEWNTTALADQLIEYIQKNPKVIPADRTLYILRLLNPDGEARGHNLDGRTNERGVDLNRNWDSFWVVDWPRDGCWNYRPISAGSGPFSEPETIALRDFIKAHKISALINYHSAALGIFAGGNPPEAESIRLAKSIAAVTDYAYPATSTGCSYTGQFADWLAMNGTAAVDLELTNHTDTDFEANKKVLSVLMKWEPSTGPKSLSGLINMAQNVPEKPTLIEQIRKFGVQTANEVNGLVFGRQEEK